MFMMMASAMRSRDHVCADFLSEVVMRGKDECQYREEEGVKKIAREELPYHSPATSFRRI